MRPTLKDYTARGVRTSRGGWRVWVRTHSKPRRSARPYRTKGVSSIAEKLTIEFEFDDDEHCALCQEAQRLSITPDELVRRAVAAWLTDMGNDTTQ